jgi:hypothetical protein
MVVAFKESPSRYRCSLFGLYFALYKIGYVISFEFLHVQSDPNSDESKVHYLIIGCLTFGVFVMAFFMKHTQKVRDYVPTKREKVYTKSRWTNK